MPRLLKRNIDYRRWQAWLLGAPVAVAVVLTLYLALRPDPAATNFYRAQKLQSAGQSESALRLYSLVASATGSSFAPLALQQKGEILTGLARRSGDDKQYRAAIAAYAQLARDYPTHSLAGQALLAAGDIAANDLRDGQSATGFYQSVLENYPANADYASQATLRLGRIALQDGDGARAQKHFTRVLQEYSRFPERCAEAQYQMGVAFETLLNSKASARSSYETTVKKWPDSVWASSAKERLAMLFYTGSANRPARRVLLEIGTLPPAASDDSRLAVLKLLLSARGLETGEAVLRGWSLTPFRAGFSPEKPERKISGEANFAVIAANAGLVFSSQKSDDPARALVKLRDELDAGHAPFVKLDGWALIVGYDSSRDEITFQKPGGERTSVPSKEFALEWRKSDYKFLSFHAPNEKLTAKNPPKPTTGDAPALTVPLYVYELPKLSTKNTHRRVLRRAVEMMDRPRENGVLLNLEALRALSQEIDSLAKAPPISPIPKPEIPREEGAEPQAGSTPGPETAAETNDALSLAQREKRWKSLRAWFGAPLQNWINARRDAAAYLEIAAKDLNDARLQKAAAEYRESILSLQRAARDLPAANIVSTDPEAGRAAFEALANELEGGALKAEKRATALMEAAA
jgi:tetratricopeptide (TPR) repeat protein